MLLLDFAELFFVVVFLISSKQFAGITFQYLHCLHCLHCIHGVSCGQLFCDMLLFTVHFLADFCWYASSSLEWWFKFGSVHISGIFTEDAFTFAACKRLWLAYIYIYPKDYNVPSRLSPYIYVYIYNSDIFWNHMW